MNIHARFNHETKTELEGQLKTCILSRNKFLRDMTRERDRADRDNSVFSIVTFKLLINGRVSSRIDDTLCRTLLSRLRRTDSIGWLDDRHLCVLMRGTEKDGASKFANAIAKMTKLQDSAFSISCYPADTKEPASHNEAGYSHLDETMQSCFAQELPVWKRAMDIIGSLLLLVCLSPVLILIALYIKIVSPGPILFKQERVGHKGKTFLFLKFRTMKQDNDVNVHKKYSLAFIHKDIPMEKLDDSGDTRIILGGKVLRKACLDELPQLYNILKGEMSLVGPRPCIPYEAEEYRRWHARRFDFVPGLTGLWQVSGKNKLTFKEMIRLDISYEKNLSFWLDVSILLRTVPTVIQLVLEASFRRTRSAARYLDDKLLLFCLTSRVLRKLRRTPHELSVMAEKQAGSQ